MTLPATLRARVAADGSDTMAKSRLSHRRALSGISRSDAEQRLSGKVGVGGDESAAKVMLEVWEMRPLNLQKKNVRRSF
jgi:hypothetical protein